MRFHYCHKSTGVIHPKAVGCNLADTKALAKFVEANAPDEDHFPIAGHLDHRRQRFDVATGEVVSREPTAEEARESARTNALSQLALLDAAAHRALLEHALGEPGAKERLQAIADRKADLRKLL